ncbi:MAG: ATP-binding cassette domain-containing protein, partial [Myxococcota bacterium]
MRGLRVTAGSGIRPGAVHLGADDPRTVTELADATGLSGPGGIIDQRHQEFRVAVDGVKLTRSGITVFNDLCCGFPRGRISVVLGGSGAGKSTLLRMIGGLQQPDSGSVRVAGQDITGLSEGALFKVRERIGMLFQGGALLDSMTVAQNAGLPLREHTKLSDSDIDAEVQRRLRAVGLDSEGALYPRQLSGGMIRRAATARALVMAPEILLVDEPFSGLDPINVRRIASLLVQLNRHLGLTVIMTSHHMASSLRMADHLVFLVDGQALAGAPADLMASDDPRVVRFLSAASDDYVEPPEPQREVPTRAEPPDPKGVGSILEQIELLGAWTLRAVAHFGRIARFAPNVGAALMRRPYRVRRLIDDVFDAGVKSL